jgi:putative transposase
MTEHRKGPHTIYDLKYHIVFITKYRKPLLAGGTGIRLRELIRQVCTSLDVRIEKGHINRDHVHLLVSAPPYVSVSKLVQRIKGLTSRRLLQENNILNKQLWGRHLWARGYFAASTGNVTEEIIAQYIQNQDITERAHDADFEVEP